MFVPRLGDKNNQESNQFQLKYRSAFSIGNQTTSLKIWTIDELLLQWNQVNGLCMFYYKNTDKKNVGVISRQLRGVTFIDIDT